MINKIEITAELKLLTGMHIGGTNEFAAIGAIDSPVVRDTITRLPMIPGTTLKGKMRTLLSRQYSDNYLPVAIKDDPQIVKNLFGSTEKNGNARLQFVDSVMCNLEELKEMGAQRATEVKFENSIDRLTAVANPRQIERVIPGAKFQISIIYNVINIDEAEQDFKAIGQAFKLLEYDYIGGSGTRGYGRVKFENIDVKSAVGNDEKLILKCKDILLEEV